MNLSELTDTELLKHINSRDALCDLAVHALFQRYQKVLIRDTLRHSYVRSNEDLAKELVQTALTSLYEKPSEWSADFANGKGASLQTWLNKKISYLLADVIRNDGLAKKRGGNIQDHLVQFRQSNVSATSHAGDIELMSQYTAHCLNQTAPSAEELAYNHSLGDAIRACMQALDPVKQYVADSALRYGTAHADIAKAQNCPEPTVRTRLHAARILLTECLNRKGFNTSTNDWRGLV